MRNRSVPVASSNPHPNCDGLALIAQLRQVPALSATFIVALTPRAGQLSDLQAAFGAGADYFLDNDTGKPYTLRNSPI